MCLMPTPDQGPLICGIQQKYWCTLPRPCLLTSEKEEVILYANLIGILSIDQLKEVQVPRKIKLIGQIAAINVVSPGSTGPQILEGIWGMGD